MKINTKNQEGFVLVVVAVLLFALIGFLGLAIDIGVLYSARTSAQGVADAAALAGAFTFINDTKSPQPQTAADNALQLALHNSILGQPVAAGKFYSIQLPGSSGANDYRNNIANCANTYVRCGDFYSTENGNMVGPTKQGVNDLIGNPPTDTWTETVGQYQTPYGLTDTSKNIAVAPIWHTCGTAGVCPAGNFPSGNATVQIIGFAVFFLDGIQGTDVVGHLINVSSCGAGGGGIPGETGGTVLAIPLRLVRTQ